MNRHRRAWSRAAAMAALALLGACSGGGGGGGARSAAAPASFGSDIVKAVDTLSLGTEAWDPIDAALSPDGKTVFFTATGPNGPGVFRVDAAGGATTAVAVGAPFQKPMGIAVNSDGHQLYVADTGAGKIFGVPLGPGAPAPLAAPGTDGLSPRGVEVLAKDGKDALYFTGRDHDGAAGLFYMAVGAATPTLEYKGVPFVDLDAVAVAKDGTMYVTDRGQAGTGEGAVWRVTPAAVERMADIHAPNFAGVAITLDQSTLLVSSLSDAGTDQVLVVEPATQKTGAFSKTIGENRNGGGIHRAQNGNTFAWADVLRPGRVYVLKT